MKLHMLLLAATIGLAGCEVHHVHHFNKDELTGCDCDNKAVVYRGGQYLPLGDEQNVKVLPPIYQSVSPYAYHMPPPPAPKVEMPEYYRLTPVEPNQAQPSGQSAPPMTQPMSYSPYYPQPMQPVQQQPVMPIPMNSGSSKNSESNIKTYLFQPAGGVVYQY
jgi:hypothetical protein